MNKTPKYLLIILRLILGAVFMYAGAIKIANPAAFAESIDNYRMLPYVLVTLLAVVLPWVEVIAGLLLIAGRRLASASFLVILMNLVFMIAISTAIIRGLDINCGCFSVSGDGMNVGFIRLAEDAAYLAAGLVIFWRAPKTSLANVKNEE